MKLKISKNKKVNISNELSSKITKINISKLQKALGGEENIAGCEYTHTKVKIFLYSRDNVDIEEIGKIKGISGVFATSKYINIVVGPSAKDLSMKL